MTEPATPEVVCQRCGKNSGFYRSVSLAGRGWVDAHIEGYEDGTIVGTQDDYVQDKETEIEFYEQWGCVACSHETHTVEDLVRIADDGEIDPIARAQKFPIPGQLTFEAA